MKRFVFYTHDGEKHEVFPKDVENAEYIKLQWVLFCSCCPFSDPLCRIRSEVSDFTNWLRKARTASAKRRKSQQIKYAPCNVIIDELLRRCKTKNELSELLCDKKLEECFSFSSGLHRGYALVDEREILFPVRNQQGYGFGYKTFFSTSFYWYNRLLIKLDCIPQIMAALEL